MMDAFLEGYRRFRADTWPQRRALFDTLARNGQRPRALVIACSDSRVDPAMVFDAAPGEIFTVRNVANLVPPYEPDGRYHGTSAALEFAVTVLEVPRVIVMGHAMCGGIAALLAQPEGVPLLPGDFVGNWISIAAEARAQAEPPDLQASCEQEAVKLSLRNLRTFPWIAEREAAGRLTLSGALFDIRTGVLQLLGAAGRFEAA